jgi:uncharacterized protein
MADLRSKGKGQKAKVGRLAIVLLVLSTALVPGQTSNTQSQLVPVPELTRRVQDTADILYGSTVMAVEALLEEHESRTTNQLAVLTIPTLSGEPIESFGIRVAEAWALGQEGSDNGLILIVVPNDRRLRIEVGYGLEHLVTDATAGRIIRDTITPRFREGDFDSGIINGIYVLLAALGDPSEEAQAAMSQSAEVYSSDTPIFPKEDYGVWGIMVLIMVGLPTLGLLMVNSQARWGCSIPLVFLLVVFVLLLLEGLRPPHWAYYVVAVLVIQCYYLLVTWLLYDLLTKIPLVRRFRKWFASQSSSGSGGSYSSGRSSWSGSSGSSWSSSSSSSFSGGGGSFGGGGASGSW